MHLVQVEDPFLLVLLEDKSYQVVVALPHCFGPELGYVPLAEEGLLPIESLNRSSI